MIDVERSSPPPESLARATSWSGEDVILALHRDFLGKCYLCETSVSLGDFDVDHRYPRALDLNRARHFDWSNLFPACDFCNGRRPAYPECGLLSPGPDGIEGRIEQVADPMSINEVVCRFSARDPNDSRAEATARELQHIHTINRASTFRARARTRELLVAIRRRYAADVFPHEREVRSLRRRRARGEPYAAADLERAEAALREAVSRRAPFTMLIRSIVGNDLDDLFD